MGSVAVRGVHTAVTRVTSQQHDEAGTVVPSDCRGDEPRGDSGPPARVPSWGGWVPLNPQPPPADPRQHSGGARPQATLAVGQLFAVLRLAFFTGAQQGVCGTMSPKLDLRGPGFWALMP